MQSDTCPIWNVPAVTKTTDRDGVYVNSPRAGGQYFISRTVEVNLRSQATEPLRARLTTWLVDQRHLGVECPEIMSTTLDEMERRRPLTVQKRCDRLLAFLADQQGHIGDPITVHVTDAAQVMYGTGVTELGARLLAHTESTQAQEGKYLLQQLVHKDFLELRNTEQYAITLDGFTHLASLEQLAVDSKQAFVAMWFDESMKAAYAGGFAPAIADAGYEPLRIDGKEHLNRIDDEIVAEIRRSRFLVADFTQGESGARGGVYYEAGFAHGLNIPVIFTCRRDMIDKAHFDTRQYNHITWEAPQELRSKLAIRVSATIGDGPLKEFIGQGGEFESGSVVADGHSSPHSDGERLGEADRRHRPSLP